MIRVFNGFAGCRRWPSLGFVALLAGYPACSARHEETPTNEGGSAGKSGAAKAGSSGQAGSKAQPGPNEAGAAGSGGGSGTAASGASSGGEVAVAPAPDFFALGSVVIDAEGARITYLQTIKSLDDGPFDNANAIEMPGNGTFLASGDSVFAGLAEEPTWIKYSADHQGRLKETGRLSFLNFGAPSIDYGNAIVSDELAVSVLSGPALAVVWNPQTMEILRTIELPHLVVEGYSVEVWTTIAHDGLVYVPGRWADWDVGKVRNGVSTTIIDPVEGEIVGVAEDDRCASGGRVVFGKDGYAYVMGDGRNYSIQMYANAAGKPAPENCLLRIAPGETDFDEDFYYSIPALTGGLESISELDTARQGGGFAFAKMFDATKLPEGVEAVDFGFWNLPVHRLWRIELADPPVAEPVEGLPYAAIGFDGFAFRGKLYTGESLDEGATSDVYENDPDANRGALRFRMDGYFNGLFELSTQ